MGNPDHGNRAVANGAPGLATIWDGLIRIGALQERMAIQLNEIREQQLKDSAELTELSMVLNELLPYARRAAAMMDKNPLGKLRAALGKGDANPGN